MHIFPAKDWLTVIGLSSLIATVVAHWFSSAREHRRWVYENKRLEWRELVDRSHTILHREFRCGLRDEILEDLNEGYLLLGNRLFISDALEIWDVQKNWDVVAWNTMERPRTSVLNPTYDYAREPLNFETYLLQIARHDLQGRWGRILHKKPKKLKLEKMPERTTRAEEIDGAAYQISKAEREGPHRSPI
jgi:hypothetical protein